MLLAAFAAAFTASALASDNTYLVASQPRCSSTTSNSLLIEWDADSTSDLFYIAFSKSSNDRPFALKTSASNSVTVDDLMPSTTYHIQLRSHPASEPTIAWAPGWSALSSFVECQTKASPAHAPANLNRAGKLDTTTITVAWAATAAATAAATGDAGYELGLVQVPDGRTRDDDDGVWHVAESQWDWSGKYVKYLRSNASSTGASLPSAVLHSLNHSSTYYVRVRTSGGSGSGSSVTSDPVRFRTAAPGMMYTTTHRISEYAEDVDFLENHNSATADAFPLYLMTCSDTGNCQPWNKTQFTPTDAAWDSCEAELANLCGNVRGVGFNGCVECVDLHHDAVVQACGNYTDADKEHPGFPIHYYCGVGWSV